jgi:hypothetical protein
MSVMVSRKFPLHLSLTRVNLYTKMVSVICLCFRCESLWVTCNRIRMHLFLCDLVIPIGASPFFLQVVVIYCYFRQPCIPVSLLGSFPILILLCFCNEIVPYNFHRWTFSHWLMLVSHLFPLYRQPYSMFAITYLLSCCNEVRLCSGFMLVSILLSWDHSYIAAVISG